MVAQDTKPFVILGEQIRALDGFHSCPARASRQPDDQQAGHHSSSDSRLAGELKASDRSLGPPGGSGDEAFDRTAPHRRQQPGVRAQWHVAEQMQDSFDLSRSRLAYRRVGGPGVAR
jgi:hypothetical protein